MAAEEGPLVRPVRRAGMKVVVFVGTFDPLHEGHMDAARKCLQTGAEEILFVPKPEVGRKRAMARRHRVAITAAATHGVTGMNVYRGDPTPYMPHEGDWSLRLLLRHVGELYNASSVGELCGSDAFAQYPASQNLQYFFGQSIYLASRPPYPEVSSLDVPACVPIGRTAEYSSSAIRQALANGAPREQLQRLGLPDHTFEYIHTHDLYSVASPSSSPTPEVACNGTH